MKTGSPGALDLTHEPLGLIRERVERVIVAVEHSGADALLPATVTGPRLERLRRLSVEAVELRRRGPERATFELVPKTNTGEQVARPIGVRRGLGVRTLPRPLRDQRPQLLALRRGQIRIKFGQPRAESLLGAVVVELCGGRRI